MVGCFDQPTRPDATPSLSALPVWMMARSYDRSYIFFPSLLFFHFVNQLQTIAPRWPRLQIALLPVRILWHQFKKSQAWAWPQLNHQSQHDRIALRASIGRSALQRSVPSPPSHARACAYALPALPPYCTIFQKEEEGDDEAMPTYHTPSPSTSKSSSPSRSDRPHRRYEEPEKPESLIKSSLVFLGSVAAATLCAHRFWPKGFTYGEKEDWEVEQELRHRNGHHRHSSRRGDGDEKDKHRRRDRGARREGYRRRSSNGLETAEGRYLAEEKEMGLEPGEEVVYRIKEKRRSSRSRDRSRGSHRSKDRSRDRSSDRGWDRHGDRGRSYARSSSRDPASPESRAARKERRYYPPAPQRYAIDRSGSTTGLPRRSSLDSGRSRKYYYSDHEVVDDQQPELVYARREPPPLRSRRGSIDDGYRERRGRSRYSDDLYYGD